MICTLPGMDLSYMGTTKSQEVVLKRTFCPRHPIPTHKKDSRHGEPLSLYSYIVSWKDETYSTF